MRPFVPLIANPHLATIASNFWPRFRELTSYPETRHRFPTEEGVSVSVVEQRPPGEPLGELVLIHGLEGSSQAGYMRSMAWAALSAGYAVHRMNIRGCGGTEGWCRTLYHAGLTVDARVYLEQLRPQAPVTLIGYSLGGNIALKLAGELGESASSRLHSVATISTPIDLAACVRALANPGNFLYERRFVRSMRNRLQERRRRQPGAFDDIFRSVDLRTVRTIFDFDDRITAPHFGFGDAANYYATQSATCFLPRIQVPALLLTAQDDPLVPFDVYRDLARGGNPNITLIAPRHGGHVAFLARTIPRFWADEVILHWIGETRNKKGSGFVCQVE